MRDDLLDAQAAVDWAISDLPILEAKIKAWVDDRPYTIFQDVETQPGKKLYRLRDVKLIPRVISAEAGAIIHSIRSSLDILAVTLAERNGHTAPKDTYFPICENLDAFMDKRRGMEKIKRLSKADTCIIENLKPYKGGNDTLHALHNLDSTRKHRRLLAAFAVPRRSVVMTFVESTEGVATAPDFISPWPGFKDEAIIASADADAPDYSIGYSLQVRLAEPGFASTEPVVATLRDFASAAYAIISLFDT
jgi:hypothetical protein